MSYHFIDSPLHVSPPPVRYPCPDGYRDDHVCTVDLLHITIVGIVLFWMLGSSSSVLGDGKVFVEERVNPVVQMPDQKALIQYENGIERLVIESSYRGAGTNFAWIIPLPTIPKVQTVEPGVFVTLQTALLPRLIHRVRGYWLAFLVAGFWIYLIRRSVWEEPSWIIDLILCLAVGMLAGLYLRSAWAAGFLFGFTLLVRLVHEQRNAGTLGHSLQLSAQL